MKKIITIIISITGFCNQAFSQSDTSSALARIIHDQSQSSPFKFQKVINYPIVSFAVNNLGELYFINTNNQLKKLNEKGDSVGVFNQVTKYGKLSYVDAQNPWKTILFYENFSTIVLLDKYLNVVTNINLRRQNIFGVNRKLV